MRKTLYCGVDLHSNNAMYVIADEQDQQLLQRRLKTLAPFRARLKVVAVESTYNWYWLVDGLQEKEYPVVLAHPSEMDQYDGIKEADDLTDAAFLARLARLNILPTGYIYPKADRPVRDLLRRRMLVVQHRTGIILSLENMAQRQTGQDVGWRTLRKLPEEERRQLLGNHDCLAFVAAEQVELIELLTKKIKRFEKKENRFWLRPQAALGGSRLSRFHSSAGFFTFPLTPSRCVCIIVTQLKSEPETPDEGGFCHEQRRCTRETPSSQRSSDEPNPRKSANSVDSLLWPPSAVARRSRCLCSEKLVRNKAKRQ